MHLAHWRQSSRGLWLLIVTALIAVDQITKAYFSTTIELFGAIEVTPWFNLVHTLNEGAAFSLLADAGGWQRSFLIVVSLLVVVPLTVICLSGKTPPADRWLGALIVAGGSGNLIDRVMSGAVVDFLDFHWNTWHWPAFNLADVFIVSAALGWLLLSLRPSAPAADATREPQP